MELCSMLCGSLDERGVWGRMDTYIYVWLSHLFQNFPQFVVIHTVKGFGTVNKAEIDVFLELSCFFDDPTDVGNLISGSSAFSKTRSEEHTSELQSHIGIAAPLAQWPDPPRL